MYLAKLLTVGCLIASVPCAVPPVWSASPPVALGKRGEELASRYTAQLKSLQEAVSKALPVVSAERKGELQAAREALRKAQAEMNSAKESLGKIETAKALVEHAKGKWIGGAEKGIAQAEAALKKAATDAEREAARKELAKWEANKQDGLNALKERQEAYDKARLDQSAQSERGRKAASQLATAQAAELAAAKALLAELQPVLSSGKLDAVLAKCAVLARATPRGLAEYAQRGTEQEKAVEALLASDALMRQMLEAGGAKGGNFGQATAIYLAIRKASRGSSEGVLHRLALGTALAHATPVEVRNAVAKTGAPSVVDPVGRYLHYEKAFLAGELDPAFREMSAWECRYIVNADAPDHVLAWGREMLRNYRPDHITNPDYGWRYSGLVRTDVAYRSSQLLEDDDSLEFFQNVLKEGGVCGRRAFFGRFIVKSFGLPTWGVGQHKHAAVGRWTPRGWVVNLGAGWDFSWSEDPADKRRTGTDFILEAQAREHPAEYWNVLRAQWIGDALGEPACDSTKEGSGGFWNNVALLSKKVIVADRKPHQLAALGQDLAEANESAESKAKAVEEAKVTDSDKRIIRGNDGSITIPAAAIGRGNQLVKSPSGGHQMICATGFNCVVEAPRPGKYKLTARVVAVHEGIRFQVTANGGGSPVDIAIPYTCGAWKTTEPVEVTLAAGKNTLGFTKPPRGFALKEFTLTRVDR